MTEPRIEYAIAKPLAIARRDNVAPGQISSVLISLLDEVYAVLATQTHVSRGQNVAIYDAHGNIEAGVEVSGDFAAAGDVAMGDTPAGRAATATHIGAYSRLGVTHAAIRDWCREHGYRAGGTSWEVYGDWEDDESRLRTDVYVLLPDEAAHP